MDNHFSNSNLSQKQLDVNQGISVYITKVYNWMAVALLLTVRWHILRLGQNN